MSTPKQLIAETRDRAADWERVYGKPNYPENLTLALRLAEALESTLAEMHGRELHHFETEQMLAEHEES